MTSKVGLPFGAPALRVFLSDDAKVIAQTIARALTAEGDIGASFAYGGDSPPLGSFGDPTSHDVPADVMDAVLYRVDLAVDKALQRFEARIAQKLEGN